MKDVCKLNQNITDKFKQVNKNTRLNASNEYYVLGC